MVRITVSYEQKEELQKILEQLRPDIKRWKVAKNQKGRFKKAYIDMKEE